MQRIDPDSLKSIYFVAICGTGMTALAGMLKSKGYEVRGSDQNVYPPMSTFLADMGIPVHNGFKESNLEPAPDLAIIGNSMSRGNPEVEAVLERKIPYTSLPSALQEFFIRGQYSCVVAGTHGKTTTSSMLAWVLEHAGKDPGFFIGGIPENFGRGFKIGAGGIFVSEGDEYDSAFFDKGSKFLHYMPDLVILNNVEYDHVDIFRSFDEVKRTFDRLINLIPRNGYLIANWDDPVVRELAANAFCQVVRYGVSEEATWRPARIRTTETATEFSILHNGKSLDDVSVPLFGEHMVLNSLAVAAAGVALGLTEEHIRSGLATFKNVRRRLQLIGEFNGAAVYDDFAHHPTEVRATIQALRNRFPGRRVWAVWEPRTATSKRKIYEKEYIDSLVSADRIILTPLHTPEKVPAAERLSIESVAKGLTKRSRPSLILNPDKEMLEFLRENVQPQDIVLFMSNGDFNQIPRKLVTGT